MFYYNVGPILSHLIHSHIRVSLNIVFNIYYIVFYIYDNIIFIIFYILFYIFFLFRNYLYWCRIPGLTSYTPTPEYHAYSIYMSFNFHKGDTFSSRVYYKYILDIAQSEQDVSPFCNESSMTYS